MASIISMIDKVKISIDTREHKLVEIFRNMEKSSSLLTENIIIEVITINSADFAISINDEIQLLIERKTLTDYAESIKDKRIEKRTLMYQQRKITKCDLSFIIEGDIYGLLCAQASNKINGISVTSIRTSIMNLQVRDKMFLYFSQNISETALIIYNLAKSYLRNYHNDQCARSSQESHQKILTMPVGCTDCEILTKMFIEIPGVTKFNVHNLIGLTFHQAYLTCDSMTDKIGTRAINSFKSLNTNDGKDLFWRIIMIIPGVSERYKSLIYPIAGFSEFITFNEDFRKQILFVLGQMTSTVSVNIYKLLVMTKLDTTKNILEQLKE